MTISFLALGICILSLGAALALPTTLDGFLQLIWSAGHDGNWPLLAMIGLIGAVYGSRKLLAKKFPWLTSDMGGTVLALLVSFLGGAAAAFAPGAVFNGALVLSALKMGFLAIGGYGVLKKLLHPLFVRLADWLGVDVPVDTLAKAVQAGQAAVKKAPAKGAAGVVGEIKEIK